MASSGHWHDLSCILFLKCYTPRKVCLASTAGIFLLRFNTYKVMSGSPMHCQVGPSLPLLSFLHEH